MLGGHRTDVFKYFKASYSERGKQSRSKLGQIFPVEAPPLCTAQTGFSEAAVDA